MNAFIFFTFYFIHVFISLLRNSTARMITVTINDTVQSIYMHGSRKKNIYNK